MRDSIHAALLKMGQTQTSWAQQHGYSQQHVSYALTAWTKRTTGMPRGRTYQILIELSHTLGWYVTPVLKGILAM